MLDCWSIEFYLECGEADRFVPYFDMNHVECEGCRKCREYDDVTSNIDNTLDKVQRLYEQTLVMQKLFDEDEQLMATMEYLDSGMTLPEEMLPMIKVNVDVLDKFAEYDPLKVVGKLVEFSHHLDRLLKGERGENMTYVLREFTAGLLDVNLAVTEVSSTDDLDMNKMMTKIETHLLTWNKNLEAIRDVIERLEPALLSLQQLTADNYAAMEENDVMSLRVAFRLITRSRDGLKSLLKMDMDKTASDLQDSIDATYQMLANAWDTTEMKLLHGGGSGDVSFDLLREGSGEEGEREEWILPAEPPKKTTDNHFYKWLSNRVKPAAAPQ